MLRSTALAGLMAGVAWAAAGQSSPDKIPSAQDFTDLQKTVETLRGKTFIHQVPVYQISAKELRAISDRVLDKQYPGDQLKNYEELQVWMDLMPPGTDLKAAEGAFLVDQLAGLYDSDTKEMCIPMAPTGTNNATKKTAQDIAPGFDSVVLAHEFTHALEDQYWPLDDPNDTNTALSTDRGTAHDFVLEGSATREMIEAVPALWSKSPDTYFLFWNLIHSGFGEFALDAVLRNAWKSSDAAVKGVPESLARDETMPYSFGYIFCATMMRQWGLDGLDYFYTHPVISSEQVMHPRDAWEWRRFPVQIHLPETLAGAWKRLIMDSEGEADIAVLFGCQFKNLNRGMELAHGWDGDHVAFYARPDGHHLLVWASSWASSAAAAEFAHALAKERQLAHHASITRDSDDRIQWESADGRAGFLRRDGPRVILLETDYRETLADPETLADQATFAEASEVAARAAANNPWLRFNPFWSWQKDGDYTVTRSLGGLLSRHDRNSIGTANLFLRGALAETRQTASLNKWEVGGGFIARHESEARRGFSKTTWLPWGVLASQSSARLPQSPDKTITRASVLWGLAGSATRDGDGGRAFHLLPFGLLYCENTAPGASSTHILGTGVSHQAAPDKTQATTRFRLFGLPLWSKRSNP